MDKVAAHMCREDGGRVSTNVIVTDMDLPSVWVGHPRRLEIGLTLFGGSQLTVVQLLCLF